MTNEFEPDWVSPPGDTLIDILKERRIGLRTCAVILSMNLPQFRLLLIGERPFTQEIGERLDRYFGTPASFWMAREAQYREALERKRVKGSANSDDSR